SRRVALPVSRLSFFCCRHGDPRPLHSFPTRRSSDLTERDQAPLAEVMRLLAREAMTGMPPPPNARRIVDLWRPVLDERVHQDLADRKSTRLNSSHVKISYAVFCLKKKTTPTRTATRS